MFRPVPRPALFASALLAAMVLLATSCNQDKKEVPSSGSPDVLSTTASDEPRRSLTAPDETPGQNESGAAAPALEGADANGLHKLFTQLQDAIRSQETATVAKITRDLFPSDASLEKAIKAPEAISKINAMHAEFSAAPDEEIVRIFTTDRARTEILVHAATTEEIAAYQDGSVAFMEFPRGAQAAAESVLQPGITFYEVELVEPGKSEGMKYHMFYHDGENWKMLGPIWRVLRE